MGSSSPSRSSVPGSPEWADTPLLYRAIRSGNQEALEWAYRTFVPQLLPFAFRYVRSREEAEEIVQSVFEKVWREREQLVVRTTFAQYLFLAVRNRAYDLLRHETVERRWRNGAILDVRTGVDEQTHNAAIETADTEAAILQALAELPERQRAVCMLRWLDGLSYAEIGQRLGISPRTVEVHLARGTLQVRQHLRTTFG